MRKLTMQEVQKESLQILKKFDTFCEENKLKYWVMYGTLLGAVRHKGFIPWDDDIDIAMPREDYEKFRAIIQKDPSLLSPYILHSYETTDGYPFYIPRLCETSHVIHFAKKKYESGIFMDIYPFDGMGGDDDRDYWVNSFRKLARIRKHLSLSTNDGMIYGRNVITRTLNIPNVIYSKCRGRLAFLRELDEIERRFKWESSKYVSIPAWDPETWFFRKEWFDELLRVPFEDTTVNIPACYKEILTERYGADYMTPPPENERKPHKEYTVFEK